MSGIQLMLNPAELDSLLKEISNPASWHWKMEKGFFSKKSEYIEAKHVQDILTELEHSNDSFSLQQADVIRTRLKDIQDVFKEQGHSEQAEAIALIIGNISPKRGGFHMPDVPVEFFSEMSDEDLDLPEALSFALSQGSVFQSAREAVIYRMNAGKDDFNYYYNTRTVAIYFKSSDGLFVAFDDDAFENILLSRAEEGRQAGDSWLVDVNDPLISRAIFRARNSNRVIQVTDENTRSDSIKVSECIIGDKTKEYADFVKKYLSPELKYYVLNNHKCSKVSSNKALIRLVGLCFGNDLGAYDLCGGKGHSRGVQKISSGNQGRVPYFGLMIFKKLRLNEAGVSPYFDATEAQLKDKKAVSLFYAGLGACKDFINSKDELDSFVNELIIIVKNKINHLKEFFLSLSKISKHNFILRADELALLAEDFSNHHKTLRDPVRLMYWIELRRHNLVNKNMSLLERLKLRRESDFKEYFLKNLFKQRYGIETNVKGLPFNTFLKMLECGEVTKEIILEAQDAINNSHKQFPTDKIYYHQNVK